MARFGPVRHKIVLCGDYGAGKTTLFQRFVTNAIDDANSPPDGTSGIVTSPSMRRRVRQATLVGMDRFCRQFTTSTGRDVQLELWDTGGMERYNTMSVGYFTASSAVVVCYSSVDHFSLRSAARHVKEVIENVGPRGVRHASDVITVARASTSRGISPFIFLCGTKFDLIEDESVSAEYESRSSRTRTVCKEDVDNVLEQLNSDVSRTFVVSSYTGYGVEDMFAAIADCLVQPNEGFTAPSDSGAFRSRPLTGSHQQTPATANGRPVDGKVVRLSSASSTRGRACCKTTAIFT